MQDGTQQKGILGSKSHLFMHSITQNFELEELRWNDDQLGALGTTVYSFWLRCCLPKGRVAPH